MKTTLVGLAVIFTTGCTTLSATKFSEAPLPQAEDKAVVTVFRTEESMLYMLREAPVYLSGSGPVNLPRGAFHRYVLYPGNYQFMTKTFDANSECVLDVALHKNKQYYIEVAPNNAAVQQLLTDAFIWMAKAAITEQITTLSVGEYNQRCEGMFAFVPTQEAPALQKLPELRQVTAD